MRALMDPRMPFCSDTKIVLLQPNILSLEYEPRNLAQLSWKIAVFEDLKSRQMSRNVNISLGF